MPFTADGSNPAPVDAAHEGETQLLDEPAPDHSKVQHFIGKSC